METKFLEKKLINIEEKQIVHLPRIIRITWIWIIIDTKHSFHIPLLISILKIIENLSFDHSSVLLVEHIVQQIDQYVCNNIEETNAVSNRRLVEEIPRLIQ